MFSSTDKYNIEQCISLPVHNTASVNNHLFNKQNASDQRISKNYKYQLNKLPFYDGLQETKLTTTTKAYQYVGHTRQVSLSKI